MNQAEIAKRVRAARAYADCSLEEFAAHTGIARQRLARIESGEREPKRMELREIAAVTGLPVEFLTAGFRSGGEHATTRDGASGEDLQSALRRIRTQLETLRSALRGSLGGTTRAPDLAALERTDPELEAIDPRLIEMVDDRLKLRIFNELYEQTSSAEQLAAYLGENVDDVLSRLKALEDDELIQAVEQPLDVPPSRRRYIAVSRFFIGDEEFARLAPATRRKLFATIIDQIQRDVQVALDFGGFDHVRCHVSRLPLRLDEEAFEEIADILWNALLAAAGANAETAARCVRDARQPEHETELVIMHFHRGPGPGG